MYQVRFYKKENKIYIPSQVFWDGNIPLHEMKFDSIIDIKNGLDERYDINYSKRTWDLVEDGMRVYVYFREKCSDVISCQAIWQIKLPHEKFPNIITFE